MDFKGNTFIGLNIKGITMHIPSTFRCRNISMSGYIERELTSFRHPFPKKPQRNPAHFTQPEYGAKIQYEPDHDTSEKLDINGKKYIQEVYIMHKQCILPY